MASHRAPACAPRLLGVVLLLTTATGLGIVIVFRTVEVASFGRTLVCAVADVQDGSCSI